jgi:hypothetical protein
MHTRFSGHNWTLPIAHVKLALLFKFSGCRVLRGSTAVEEGHLSKWR